MPQVLDAPVSQYEALRQYTISEQPQADADLEAAQLMKARLFDLPAELFHSPIVTICSVWPERVRSQAFQHGGAARRIYTIEPGSPERPSYLSLQNTFTMIQTQVGSQEIGYQQAPVLAANIAMDIIQNATGDHTGNARGKKGIGVIKGRIREGGIVEATAEEIKNLVQLQDGFLQFLVERADEYYDIGKREKITNEHRKALKMLGQDINLHPWYRSKVQLYNSCPRCAEKVLVEANFCKHCHTDLVKYFMDMNEIPSGDAWPTVVKAIERLTKKQVPEKPALKPVA